MFEGYCVGIYKFTDEAGNDFTWFASRDPQTAYIEGETYRIKATVKRHGVYDGCRQTQIIRLRNLGLMPKAYEPITEPVRNAWDLI